MLNILVPQKNHTPSLEIDLGEYQGFVVVNKDFLIILTRKGFFILLLNFISTFRFKFIALQFA
jgi:hypothetical protein